VELKKILRFFVNRARGFLHIMALLRRH